MLMLAWVSTTAAPQGLCVRGCVYMQHLVHAQHLGLTNPVFKPTCLCVCRSHGVCGVPAQLQVRLCVGMCALRVVVAEHLLLQPLSNAGGGMDA